MHACAAKPLAQPVTVGACCRTACCRPSLPRRLCSPNTQYGLVAGGLADGSVCVWNPARIIGHKAEAAPTSPAGSRGQLLARLQKHAGAVRGLEFNPFRCVDDGCRRLGACSCDMLHRLMLHFIGGSQLAGRVRLSASRLVPAATLLPLLALPPAHLPLNPALPCHLQPQPAGQRWRRRRALHLGCGQPCAAVALPCNEGRRWCVCLMHLN